MLGLFRTGYEDETILNVVAFVGTLADGKKHGNTQEKTVGSLGDGLFPGVTTHCGCIYHSPVAGFSFLVFEVS
jgi:hypothetical protein